MRARAGSQLPGREPTELTTGCRPPNRPRGSGRLGPNCQGGRSCEEGPGEAWASQPVAPSSGLFSLSKLFPIYQGRGTLFRLEANQPTWGISHPISLEISCPQAYRWRRASPPPKGFSEKEPGTASCLHNENGHCVPDHANPVCLHQLSLGRAQRPPAHWAPSQKLCTAASPTLTTKPTAFLFSFKLEYNCFTMLC